jgi:hypothetical protein
MIRRFNFHWIEWTVIIVLIMVIFFAVAGNSGAALWLKSGLHLAGQGLSWLSGGIQQLVNGIAK